ncbi:MAG: apolipoprotein N-acyltransferase [Microthrixaceae bacterium]
MPTSAVPPDRAAPTGRAVAPIGTWRSSRARTAALSLLAGSSVALALPPWGWWPLAPVGLALWLWLLEGAGWKRRALIGWLVGIGWFGPTTLWMWGLTAAGYPFGVVFGWGPMVAATSALVPGDRRRFLVLPAAVVIFEWAHSHAPFGGVPLSMLGMTQTRAPLLPIARIGGVLLVGAAVCALGVAVNLAVTRRAWRTAAAVLAVTGLLAGFGSLWPLGEPSGTVRIAAVQGGGPQGTRYSSGEEPLVFERHLEATRSIPANEDLAPEDRVDLVVWPENAINVSGYFEDDPWRDEVAEQAERIGAPVVVGAVNDSPLGDDRFENFVVVVNPDGSLGDRFDKVRRVPFGEYVPMRWLFEPVAGSTLPPRDQVPGEAPAVIDTPQGPMAVVVSWEVFFSRRVREGVREGGEVVLNPTNGSSYWLTQVQTQQVASSQLRALESGRWVVQVSPTGFSAFVDPDGVVHQRSEISRGRC